MSDLRTGALILAAGRSSRMKKFKPLLQLGDKTLIEYVIGLFESTGIDEIVTVVGHLSKDLIPVVEKTTSRWINNRRYDEGMFSSIQQGVQALRNRCDCFFLLPVDIVLVRQESVRTLLESFKKNSSILICIPSHRLRRGHPPLISSSLIDKIQEFDGLDGMRGFLRQYENRTRIIPVPDKYILMDIDTMDDFILFQKEVKNIS